MRLWRQKIKLPATFWGFPVEAAGKSTANHRHQGKRGIALVIAIMIISVMMLFTTDLILSSQVNMSLATSARDNLKADYMAKSGFNAAKLLLSADLAYDLFQAQQDPKATLSDGAGDIWSSLNGLPIGGETLEMMSSFQEQFSLNAVLDGGILDQLKLFDGSFTIDVADESQKININDCATSRCSETMLMLTALLQCPAEKAYLDEKRITGSELAYRMKDWVDTDSRAEEASGYNDENDPYQKRVPKIVAKNAPIDTIDELRMIEGWDEQIHTIFSPYITAFPFSASTTNRNFKLNINTASRALLQCLFPETKGECAETSVMALKKRDDNKANMGTAGQKIPDILKDSLCYSGDEASAGEATNRVGWFQQSSMVYRVQIDGTVGGSVKKLTAVIERTVPDPQKAEKAAYKILFWKII